MIKEVHYPFSGDQFQKVVGAVGDMIEAFDIPIEFSSGLADTPNRVAKMYDEMLSGYMHKDGEHLLLTNFSDPEDGALTAYDQMVQCRDINFWSLCEHHMCPFFGSAHIGYIPSQKIVGLSKLPRLVELYARRLQVQERMTQQILNDIVKYVQPRGVMVVIEATHTCCVMRGIRTPNADTVTSQCYGAMFENGAARMEYLTLLTQKK